MKSGVRGRSPRDERRAAPKPARVPSGDRPTYPSDEGRLFQISDAAQATGLSARMIRHYEGLGLLPPSARTEAGYRLYGDRELQALRFISQARRLGFSMKQISGLLQLWNDPHRASREVKALAAEHLAELARQRDAIEQMQGTLEKLIAACPGDEGADCAILDELAHRAH